MSKRRLAPLTLDTPLASMPSPHESRISTL